MIEYTLNTELHTGTESTIRNRIVQASLRYIGYPSTRYKGRSNVMNTDFGFTCAGLVRQVLLEAGVPLLPFKTFGQNGLPEERELCHANEFFVKFGEPVDGRLKKPGDLVFFSKRGLVVKHVGIVIDDDHCVYSPGRDTGKVMIGDIYNLPHFPKDIPFLLSEQRYLTNPVGFRTPVEFNGDINRNLRWPEKPI